MEEDNASLLRTLYENLGDVYEAYRSSPPDASRDFWDGAVCVLVDTISELTNEPAEYILAEIEGAFDGLDFEDRINEALAEIVLW